MKLTPRSIAVRTMRRLSCSSTLGSPRCQPPIPIGDTRSPVLPRTRYSEMEFSALLGILLQSRASHRYPRQCGEIALAVPSRKGFQKTLVHNIGQRHWCGDFLRCR